MKCSWREGSKSNKVMKNEKYTVSNATKNKKVGSLSIQSMPLAGGGCLIFKWLLDISGCSQGRGGWLWRGLDWTAVASAFHLDKVAFVGGIFVKSPHVATKGVFVPKGFATDFTGDAAGLVLVHVADVSGQGVPGQLLLTVGTGLLLRHVAIAGLSTTLIKGWTKEKRNKIT